MSRQSLAVNNSGGADGHDAGGRFLAVHADHDLERAGRFWHDVGGLDFDFRFAGRKLLGGADVRAWSSNRLYS